MNDADRWVHQQGEAPPWIRDLLDAIPGLPPMSRGQSERMKRTFLAMLVERRRRQARARTVKMAALAALVIGSAVWAVSLQVLPVMGSVREMVRTSLEVDMHRAPSAAPSGAAFSRH